VRWRGAFMSISVCLPEEEYAIFQRIYNMQNSIRRIS
jgi:hypothetical protein